MVCFTGIHELFIFLVYSFIYVFVELIVYYAFSISPIYQFNFIAMKSSRRRCDVISLSKGRAHLSTGCIGCYERSSLVARKLQCALVNGIDNGL